MPRLQTRDRRCSTGRSLQLRRLDSESPSPFVEEVALVEHQRIGIDPSFELAQPQPRRGIIERPAVRALPVSAVTQIGNQTYCYLALDGKAVRTPVQTSVSDGTWVEVTGKLVRSAGSSEGAWEPFDGSEAVIDGNLSEISDGVPVQVEPGH